MSNLRVICRPHLAVYSSITCCYNRARCRPRSVVRVSNSIRNPKSSKPRLSSSRSAVFSPGIESSDVLKTESLWAGFSNHQRRMLVRAVNWSDEKSPYDTLELEGDANEDEIKLAYRRLAKYYHPDGLPFSTILIRGDMAIAAWAEQQQQELNIRVRRLSRSKIDPDEERRILAKEKKASMENFNNTLKRHTLVLRKRDLMRKKAEEEKKKLIISKLLAAEGLELASDEDDASS
ncbi:DnaJ domain-containing protein [Cynara cardunculus var. scolymus]|uniref:DnaJ domain-containing protein n=1 Tax=Cynara cardunculus var. scolymus TaxID=59895 RepID=A0A124SEB1_CYNCS|nr:DnaJ domain-containing protein [Cynara cardunculus var. scolymus]